MAATKEEKAGTPPPGQGERRGERESPPHPAQKNAPGAVRTPRGPRGAGEGGARDAEGRRREVGAPGVRGPGRDRSPERAAGRDRLRGQGRPEAQGQDPEGALEEGESKEAGAGKEGGRVMSVSARKIYRPIAEVLPAVEALVAALRMSCHRIEVAGSVRRRKAEVGDVEIVAVPRVDTFEVEGVDLFGPTKPVAVHRNHLWAALDPMVEYWKRGEKYRQFAWPVEGGEPVQVDLFTADRDNFGWCLLQRTGSWEFSKHVAGCLNRNGYTSKEGYIRFRDPMPGGLERVMTFEEGDVFRLAGLDFVRPEQRSW